MDEELDEIIGEADPETWGEAADLIAKGLSYLESVTPPTEFRGFHSATIAVQRAIYELSRSQGANEAFNWDLLNPFWTTDKGRAVLRDWVGAWVSEITALDDEAGSQVEDAGLGDTDCTN